MAAGLVGRALGLIEQLAGAAEGSSLALLADRLGLPKATAHRLLAELVQLGYVRQDARSGDYQLTTRLVSLGFRYLSATGVSDLVQPVLDRLARQSAELVRMAVVDGDRLVWVAKAQGARSGLRYDPEMGEAVWLYCTASGHAWLSTLDDGRALEVIGRQGFGKLTDHGPNAPRTIPALLERLSEARQDGFAAVLDSGGRGMAAVAAPVRLAGGAAVATVSIAGPSARLTRERMAALGPALVQAATDLGAASHTSPLLQAGGAR